MQNPSNNEEASPMTMVTVYLVGLTEGWHHTSFNRTISDPEIIDVEPSATPEELQQEYWPFLNKSAQ